MPHQRRIGRTTASAVTGHDHTWDPPAGDHVRVDSHAFAGYEIPPYYDSLIAKLIVAGTDRAEAIEASRRRSTTSQIEGIDTTRDLQRAVLSHADFGNDAINTRWLETTLLPAMLSTTSAKD